MLKKMKRHRFSVEIFLTAYPGLEIDLEEMKEDIVGGLDDYDVGEVKLLDIVEVEVERKRPYRILKDTVTGAKGPEWNCLWQAWSSDNYYACQSAANEFPDLFPVRDETGNRVPLTAYNNAGSPSGSLLLNKMRDLGMEEVEGYEYKTLLPFLRAWGKKQVTAEGKPRFIVINEDGGEEPFN